MPFYQADQVDVPHIFYSLWTGAEYGDLPCVRAHVEQRHKAPGLLDAYGYAALHLAAQHDHVDIVRYLVERGAPVDGGAGAACTPLHRAAYAGAAAACGILLRAGADVAARDASFGDLRTPLHKAADRGHGAVAAALLDFGAAVGACDSAGETPLHVAARRGHVDVIHLLVGRGADARATSARGRTPAHCAADAGEEAAFVALGGATDDARDADGHTPNDLLRSRAEQTETAPEPEPSEADPETDSRARPGTDEDGVELGYVDTGGGPWVVEIVERQRSRQHRPNAPLEPLVGGFALRPMARQAAAEHDALRRPPPLPVACSAAANSVFASMRASDDRRRTRAGPTTSVA
ncbi:ankyrin repeat-containing domain protein [Pelagophyceae sp. CCMP2097]|nr:ankyrin repeat-containing domain protein [Pelagophyceae sp. CCMP2097]